MSESKKKSIITLEEFIENTEEKLKEEPKKTRGRKKAEETKNDNLAEDFLNNLDMTMRKG